MSSISTVNRWARLSCDRWNKFRLSRIIHRKLYQHAAAQFIKSNLGRLRTQQYQDSGYYLNSYPWPYSDPDFANWPESNVTGEVTLVTDQSNFVVKHGTSYCAWKIFESTGKWPQSKTPRRFEARDWKDFLEEAGYDTIVTEPLRGHRYVGIKEHDCGIEGDVVWFEKVQDFFHKDRVTISTYRNKKHFIGAVDPKEYLWIQII